jgi:hypothetical protein
MGASDTYDRYVTWGIFVPDGVAVAMPYLDPWSLPVWFPDPTTFYPKDVEAMYAIRATSDSTVLDLQGNAVDCPLPGWFTYSASGYQYVPDQYFAGGVPDTSGGLQYPPEAQRHYDVTPPDWVINGTDPNPTPPPNNGGGDWTQQPDPGGGGMTTPTDPTGNDPSGTPPDPSSGQPGAATAPQDAITVAEDDPTVVDEDTTADTPEESA